MRHLVAGLAIAAAVLVTLPALALDCAGSPLNHDQKRLLGGTENLCTSYGGKVILVVNTASRCGYTPQFEGLEKLYRSYKDQGLVVLGFPSDQFHQEESSDESVARFCTANFGVTFPMYTRSQVDGSAANPVYKALKAATGKAPDWNFNKYLIGRDGHTVRHYGSGVRPEDAALLDAIQAELAKPAVTAQAGR